ncbi:MAG TPA: hypothetical protein VHX88_00390, partial [Solirubrobacteraceae bacterium]|nr:hypothetical protein [Solirubrobacteraceae bacterium]
PDRRAVALVAAAIALALGAPAASARLTTADPSGTPTAPSVLPTAPTTPPTSDPAAGQATGSGGDPLVANGLGSPECEGAPADLSPSSAANCRASGFTAAPEPIDDYAFDVHINTGITDLTGDVDSIFEDLVLTPVWTALLWLVHGVIVALEWCFSLNLLDDATMGQVAGALRSAQATITQPWLVTVLAVAAVIAAYHGLVRRRVAQTVGEAVLVLAMIAAGLWVIVDPVGTVGQASALVNSASLGTLGAVISGDPNHAESSFDDALQGLFDSAVRAPWCYMEFGEVDWCQDPAQLDAPLRAAAEHWAAETSSSAGSLVDPQDAALVHGARTNGQLFLAFPANGPVRNSINNPRSLLAVLCGASNTSRCHGATASEAVFRTESGIWSRAGGLLFIIAGSLGMLALLGFITLRLLGAAVCTLVYLLLAPVAVLAPALGEGGRGAFRRWALRLLGAVLAKLLYSLLLGVILLVYGVLSSLGTLGWWTQWLLSAAFWWIVYHHRHQLLEFTTLGQRDRESRPVRIAPLRRARDLSLAARPFARRRDHAPPPALPRPAQAPEQRRIETAKAYRGQEGESLAHDHRGAVHEARRGRGERAGLAGDTARLKDIEDEREKARLAGDRRQELRLRDRGERLGRSIAERESELEAARARRDTGRRARLPGGGRLREQQLDERRRVLDRQAQLPRGEAQDVHAPAHRRRDYEAIAPLIGVERAEYRRADPPERLAMRARIDRELDARRRGMDTLGRHPATGARTASRPADSPSPSRERSAEVRRRDSAVLRRERQFGDAIRRQRGQDPDRTPP